MGAGAPTTPRATAALGLTGAMVVYGVGDIVEEDAGPRLRRGDEVLLRVRHVLLHLQPYGVLHIFLSSCR